MLKIIIILLPLLSFNTIAKEVKILDLPSDEVLEVRVFAAASDTLILGLPCDFGASVNQESTAQDLAADGLEVWMSDFLNAYMLTKTKSDLGKIGDKDLVFLLKSALQTGKKVYLLTSGIEAELALRTIAAAEAENVDLTNFAGTLLLFPRLYAKTPEPGTEPVYTPSVGKTTKPIVIIEGGNTPNKWGLTHLKAKLSAGGSQVITKIIPDIRGYFFNRKDPNMEENIVTSQLSGVIKVGMFFIDKIHQKDL
jgi:hypothetical protein